MKITPLLNKFSDLYTHYGSGATKNLFLIASAILQARTVNLYVLRDELGKLLSNKTTDPSSHYKRLTRFFQDWKRSALWLSVLRFSYKLLNKGHMRYLYLDGTAWKIGSFNLHVLVLALDIEGVAVPVFFRVYEHKGVLSQQKRISFIKKAMKLYSFDALTLIADREFIGQEWFGALSELGLHFVIRIRKNLYQNDLTGKVSYEKLRQRALKKGKASAIVLVNEIRYRLWMIKHEKKEEKEPLIYLLSSRLTNRTSPELYKYRWKIEYCFKHLKSNGFNLEQMSLKDKHKIRLLIALVILAYVIAILQAWQSRKEKPVKKKYYKKRQIAYDQISVPKQGISIVKQQLYTFNEVLLMLINNLNRVT